MSMHVGWFPPDILPVRAGVYQRDYGGSGEHDICFCWFDGSHWFAQCWTVMDARHMTIRSLVPAPWRGLTIEEFTQRHADRQRQTARAVIDALP